MEDEILYVSDNHSVNEFCSVMDMEDSVIDSSKDCGGAFHYEKGEASNVVFSRESPLLTKSSTVSGSCDCSNKKHKAGIIVAELDHRQKDKHGQGKKTNRQNRVELGRAFQAAVSSRDLERAESLVVYADLQALNDALCIALDSIWFLSNEEELFGINGLIKKIVVNGANDFTRAALRTSFLASCVSACQSRTMSLAETVTVMAQRCVIGWDICLNFPVVALLCFLVIKRKERMVLAYDAWRDLLT